MAEGYNQKLCDERHEEITRKFNTLFLKLDILSVFIALFTLIATLILIKGGV